MPSPRGEVSFVVQDKETQQLATDALKDIKGLIKQCEDSRKSVKAPVLDIGSKIDTAAKQYTLELLTESNRINELIQAHYRAELAKAAEVQRMQEDMIRRQRERAARAEREALEKQRELERQAAATRNAEEALRLQEEAAKVAAAREEKAVETQASLDLAESRAVAAPVKAAGMVAKKEWKARVIDVAKLYAANPQLCRLEANASAINAALRDGLRECPGLEIYEDVSTTVRT